jgi:hypothetical protein
MESGRRRIDVVEFMELAEAIGFSAPKLIEALLQTKKLALPRRGRQNRLCSGGVERELKR